MEKFIYIALFAPLVGSLIAALFSTQPKTAFTGWFTSFMLAVSMYASLNLLHFVYTTDTTLHANLFDWIVVGNLNIPFGFVVDHVSVVMMTVVTVVSTMVHIHSIGYMEHDKGFVEALKYGMPPTCGFGFSERLFSYLSGKPIRECVLFPLVKPEEDKKKK